VYLKQVGQLALSEVTWLLDKFLSTEGPFPSDHDILPYLVVRSKGGEVPLEKMKLSCADRQALRSALTGGKVPPRDSIKRILDLVDDAPQDALRALEAYFQCHWRRLPDGRIDGLLDAMAIIRARCATALVPDEALDDVTPRDLEFLVAALYERMGFAVEVTKATRDGGRDVIARKSERGSKTTIMVNATRSTKQIGRPHLDTMLGVVDRYRANLGVIVSMSSSSGEAEALANEHPRIDVINRERFIELMNAHFGPQWPNRLDRIVTMAKVQYRRGRAG
jgi:restriction system protein